MEDFEAYVRARSSALLRYAHLLTGSPSRSEDLVQGALASAFRHWRQIADDPEPYVRRSILNAHLSRWRRLLIREVLVADAPEQMASPPVDLEQRDAMWRALALLPPRQRAVVVLRFYEDLDVAATAHALGVSSGTVKSQTSKALVTLRTALTQEVAR